MRVILLDYVYKHGVAGEVIEVADGFARNFLIPRKLAVKASPGELKRATKLREQAAARRAALENRLNELARQIDGVELVFGRRAAATGKLFGSVTTTEIAEELMKATGVDINRRRISQQSLREIGMHHVPVRMGTEFSPVLKVIIVPEQELAEFLAARQRGENPEVEMPVVEETVEEVVEAEEPVETDEEAAE
jgi:large subunit ribosomal protein L9